LGEFDLDKAVWSIPASRMKMKEAHVVPLAPAPVKQRHLSGNFHPASREIKQERRST
jgi:integrase